MPNLEGLGLQNFRTFNKKEFLEFAPITIITGTNNAGKSSVFKAIQFLVHNFKEGNVSSTLDFKVMNHELGNLERIINRDNMEKFKSSKITEYQHMYSRLSNFKIDSTLDNREIFEDDEDLVFILPIKFGNNREIKTTLEIRYGLQKFIRKATTNQFDFNLDIKNIAIILNGEYLHWSNIIDFIDNYEDGDYWEMKTYIDLKKIVQLILETNLKEVNEQCRPNKKTEKYFTIDLYSRIEEYKRIFFDPPFFKTKKDDYENFTKKVIEGKNLFSDYSKLTEEEKSKLQAIEQTVTTALLNGLDNSQSKILECFKHRFSNIINGIERDIVTAELKKEETEEKHETSKEQNLYGLFNNSFKTTANSELFTDLLNSIEKDLLNSTKEKIDSLKRVYFLPTTRGKNRAWFIDEQNGLDIEIIRDFSTIYLDSYPPIKNFVNFWIGNGEINEVNENGVNKKQKGFKIGKELSIFRDETIGLTKVFLVNFDGTKTPLVDLGYGISQLLPIIMKIAIIAYKHQVPYEYDHQYSSHRETIYFRPSTLLIEEPEANLHPSLQSKMAELFIDAASRFNIQFLIETHSEYLIYKFQEYIGRKIFSPNDVKMYYFNRPNDVKEGLKDKYINHVQIDTDGSIDYNKYFGEGFFDEQINLKLSLFNIQRNRFTEDYKLIRESLKKHHKTLKDYDTKIENLNKVLISSTSDKNELEKELDTVKKDKADKELEFQELLKRQEEKIDEYTAKTDYSKYIIEIESIINKTKIDNSKTLQYLSTGKYLLKTLDYSADFAPVIMQYGRAVEFEMIKWLKNFKQSLCPARINTFCNKTNYSSEIRKVFTSLSFPLVDDNYQINGDNKVNIFNLKKYMNLADDKWVFGELTQIFELFFLISPSKNSSYNYNSVPLMIEFSNYLKNNWADYNTAEELFDTFRNILKLRNCAGHTYNDTICNSDTIDKATAEDYVSKVEAIFRCL